MCISGSFVCLILRNDYISWLCSTEAVLRFSLTPRCNVHFVMSLSSPTVSQSLRWFHLLFVAFIFSSFGVFSNTSLLRPVSCLSFVLIVSSCPIFSWVSFCSSWVSLKYVGKDGHLVSSSAWECLAQSGLFTNMAASFQPVSQSSCYTSPRWPVSGSVCDCYVESLHNHHCSQNVGCFRYCVQVQSPHPNLLFSLG